MTIYDHSLKFSLIENQIYFSELAYYFLTIDILITKPSTLPKVEVLTYMHWS